MRVQAHTPQCLSLRLTRSVTSGIDLKSMLPKLLTAAAKMSYFAVIGRILMLRKETWP